MSFRSRFSSAAAALVNAVYFSPLRGVIGALFRALTPAGDIRVAFPGYYVFVRTPDRLLAALLCRYSFASGAEPSLYRARVKPGMTVLEIGANVGFYTPLLSALAGPGGRVYAFEPDPENFRLLEKAVAHNGLPNVTCVMKAVAQKSGPATLYLSEEHRGDHRIFEAGPGRTRLPIETVSIDDFLPAGTHPDFVKVDIQGAEHAALLGMARALGGAGATTMLLEFSPSLLRRAGADPAATLGLLRGFGFSVSRLGEAGKALPAGDAEILAACGADGYANLLLEKPPCAG